MQKKIFLTRNEKEIHFILKQNALRRATASLSPITVRDWIRFKQIHNSTSALFGTLLVMLRGEGKVVLKSMLYINKSLRLLKKKKINYKKKPPLNPIFVCS